MRSRIALARCLVALLFTFAALPAWAEGTLTHLSGPVEVRTAAGMSSPGLVGAKVSVGDTVVTGTGAYVRMEMTDGGEMVLRPDSQLQVQNYTFAQDKPAEDSFIFSMLKGGMRTVTGLIGKRGNRDAYRLKTATATIGIRGTQFDLRVCAANCGALADGTYLAVRFGSVQTTNAAGTLAVAAGQVAFVPPERAPVILPRDPGIGFTPPAVIPKLDEKKKPSAPAASQSPGETTAKAAAAGAPAAEQKQEEKKEARQEAKQDAKPNGESQSRGQAAAAPQAADSGAVECAVE